jgi:NADH:ubiquinone oxidoreductase subunit 5 (subunit L)/multisubunit Na+/H+ antiporter MnhA subunit
VAFSRKAVTVSAVAGFGLLLAIWVIGQDFGQIYSGQATDPNTGVIAIVVAVGPLPLRRRRARREFDEGAC